MRCSFVHFGDVHLGTLQYDTPERLDDFGRAWLFACEHIARKRPDFAICTGDLFNRFTINPITFDQAYAGLAMLRDARVPIVDIQGNHDRSRFGEPKNWLQTFADQGLLTYLDVDTRADGIQLQPVVPGQHQGSYVEWSGCRIVGLRYLGASTDRVLQLVEPALRQFGDDGVFNILVLHAGLEGIVPNFNAELTVDAVERLRGPVDYVALGHIHKNYAIGNFAYNGGSLETWAANEWGWTRGILDVDVDTSRTPAVQVQVVDVPRRPFCILRVDVDRFETPGALMASCWERLQHERNTLYERRPVLILSLEGRLRFDESDLPINKLEDACRNVLDPLVTKVQENFDARDFVTVGGDDEERVVDRAVLERAILRARLAQDERFASHANALAGVATDLKERALHDDDGPTLLRALRSGLREVREAASEVTLADIVPVVLEIAP